MNIQWLYAILGALALWILWRLYASRREDGDVLFYQYFGGSTYIVRRKKVNFLFTRYRIYSAFTFTNLGEVAKIKRFYFLFQARQWLSSRSGGNKLRVFKKIDNFLFGVSRGGQVVLLPGDNWNGETILAKNVKRGTSIEASAQTLFKYWLGKDSIQKGKLAL